MYTFPGPSYVSLRRNQATHSGEHLTCPSRKEGTHTRSGVPPEGAGRDPMPASHQLTA
jgi:hypothetical protein